MANEESDVSAVGSRRRREHVHGVVVTQRGGTQRVCRLGKSHRRVFVVGMEAQTLPSVPHVFCESRAEGVR